MFKKIIRKLGLLAIIVIFLASCSVGGDRTAEDNGLNTVTVTTSFLYDMVNELAGDFVNVELVIPAGEDPHMYIAKPRDLEKLANADLVLYHGLHFEGKLEEALVQLGHEVTSDFPADRIDRMEDDGFTVIDPHFWFDIDLYQMAVDKATEYLVELEPEHSEEIEENRNRYKEELEELDAYVAEQIQSIPEAHRYLITPHDAFNYFSKAYDLPVTAPQGMSTDSEVANKDIDDTVNFIVDYEIKAIFAESTTDPTRMEKLQEGARAKGFDVEVVSGEGNELFSDSLAPEGEQGDTYIDMYRHNVDLIVEHLK